LREISPGRACGKCRKVPTLFGQTFPSTCTKSMLFMEFHRCVIFNQACSFRRPEQELAMLSHNILGLPIEKPEEPLFLRGCNAFGLSYSSFPPFGLMLTQNGENSISDWSKTAAGECKTRLPETVNYDCRRKKTGNFTICLTRPDRDLSLNHAC
jgi:hypothetical protein